jgi:hypothetical protein
MTDRRYSDSEGATMNRLAVPILAFGLLVAVMSSVSAAEPNAEQAKAVAEIEKLGGRVKVDEKSPGKPVILVYLDGTQVTDAGLEHLKGLSQLRTLNLKDTQVTDAGLKRLKGLSQLQSLDLANTRATDAGLEYLNGLTQLQTLFLEGTQVTDAGLEHLKGLTQLRWLAVNGTRVTDAGAKDLQQALPQVRITPPVLSTAEPNAEQAKKAIAEIENLGGRVKVDERSPGKPVVLVYLDGTKVTDAGLEHLNGLTQLRWLALNGTRVTDAGLAHLKGRSQLRELELWGTQVPRDTNYVRVVENSPVYVGDYHDSSCTDETGRDDLRCRSLRLSHCNQ